MNNINRLLFVVLVCMSLCACEDIFESDLSHSQITVVSPQDSFVSKNYDVVFWWKEVDKAKAYRIQIVSPSFDNIRKIVADTNVTGEKITLFLGPGSYQWRICAKNGSSMTPYVTRNIIIDTNSDFTGQNFPISAPQNNFNSNKPIVNFSWPVYPYASSYEYNLYDANNNLLKVKTVIPNMLADTLVEGVYYWTVRAHNDQNGSATNYSPFRMLAIDFTAPLPSMPLSPADNSLDTNSVQLSWTRPADVYGDSLFVASDSVFQNIITKAYVVTGSGYTLQPLPINTVYYWRLRSRDAAGNTGNYSQFFRFTVTF